jgi:hypothetical protein
MPPLVYPPAAPESIGEVLDAGFRIFQRTLLRCLLYSVLAMLAGQLANLRDLLWGHPLRQGADRDATWWLFYFGSLAVTAILWSAVVLRQDALCRARRDTAWQDLTAALTCLPQLAVLLLIAVIAVLLLAPSLYFAALYLAPGLLQPSWPALALSIPALTRAPLWLTMALGLAALGCYLTPGLMMAWPSILLLRRGPIEAVRHGLRLVRGHWWRTGAILGILTVVVVVLDTLAGVAAALVFTLSGQGDVARAIAMAGATVVVASVIGMPLTCAFTLALFSDLRVRREGLDLERRIRAPVITQN